LKILVISSVYYPDTVSVSQHVTDMCEGLVQRGHEVDVISSIYSYEKNENFGENKLSHNGVNIYRLKPTRFSKNNVIGRLSNFISFNFLMSVRLLIVRKGEYNIMIGLTVPPLLSFIGVLISKLKRIKFCYWLMDVQPELAISSGLLKKRSLVSFTLEFLGSYIITKADLIIALDNYMKNHCISNGAEQEVVKVSTVWPVMNKLYTGARLDNPFRIENNFKDKIVIMYSGNHSFVHPLDTILGVAKMLENDQRFLFVFIGEGVRKKDVKEYKELHELNNIVQLPYQPRAIIHESLGSSDFQLVIMGDGQVGFTHPNKVYGALFIGKPVIYIGPKKCHVTDLLDQLDGNISVQHGEVEILKNKLLSYSERLDDVQEVGSKNMEFARSKFNPNVLKNQLFGFIEDMK